jgi:hypothetical protein
MPLRPSQRSRPRTVLAGLALACALALGGAGKAHASPLDGNGMWIWYVSASGGTAEAIAKKANKRNIDVVMIKSSDAGNYWDQFSPELVDVLHNAGLQVCAWQFVYGRDPVVEALRGADAVSNGADCLLIDAESHYEGRYKAADRYIDELRDQIGVDYPLALASFPYVDYHPSFPYSVFLGPGAAQFNVPQMYWRAIGTSVPKVYAHTYLVNAPYERPIFPLGQTWQNPGRKQIVKFRKYGRRYDAAGVSWWSWQETKGREWRWVGKPLSTDQSKARASGAGAAGAYTTIGGGDRGDLVVWAQQLLRAQGRSIAPDGVFDGEMVAAVRGFQAQAGLRQSGDVDPGTWTKLLTREPDPIDWSGRPAPAVPASASLDALRFEVPLTPGLP